MKRIIFLDVDGVLNTGCDNNISIDMINRLAKLSKGTDSDIILHSGWRFWFDDNMNPITDEARQLANAFYTAGIVLAGKTPDLSDSKIKKEKLFSKVKASEIIMWIKDHPDVTSWVVLDDIDLGHNLVAQHQVLVNPEAGLTLNDIIRAEEILLS